jgi:3-isopropylmalate dehydratase small subunit
MEPVSQIDGRAIPFGRKNVDTDIIIPAHWLKTISRDGLGRVRSKRCGKTRTTCSTAPSSPARRS